MPLQAHQKSTLNPIYRRVEIMEEFTHSVRRSYEELEKKLQGTGFKLKELDKSPFQFISRAWPPDQDEPAFFYYRYFNCRSFDDDPSALSKVRGALYENMKLTAGFEAYLGSIDSDSAAVKKARSWLAEEGQSSSNGAELHHHLLVLFCNTPVFGLIPGTLLEIMTKAASSADCGASIPMSYYVKTVSPFRGASQYPSLSITPLTREGPGKERLEEQKPIHENEAASARDFFLEGPDSWFRYGPTADAGLIGIHMLWLPVFGFYGKGGLPGGFFRGWIFQFLGERWQGRLSNEYLASLAKYAGICHLSLPLLSGRLFEQALREVQSEDLVERDALRTLCEYIHRVGGWAKPSVEKNPVWLVPGGKVFHVDRAGAVEVSLESGPLDELWRWTQAAKGDVTDRVAIRLVPRSGEFWEPPEEDYWALVAAEVRELYLHFSLMAKRINSAEEARLAKLETSREVALAHTYKRVLARIPEMVIGADRGWVDLKQVQLVGITSTYLSFQFAWRQFIRRSLEIDTEGDWYGLQDFLEAMLIPILGIHAPSAADSPDLEKLKRYCRSIKRMLDAREDVLGKRDYAEFLMDARTRKELLASLTPRDPKTLVVQSHDAVQLNGPRQKTSYCALSLALHELLFNAFKASRAETQRLWISAGTDALVLSDERPTSSPLDLSSERLMTIDEFLEGRDGSSSSFGLRTIEMVLSANCMDYRIAESQELGFVRVIGRAFTSGHFRVAT